MFTATVLGLLIVSIIPIIAVDTVISIGVDCSKVAVYSASKHIKKDISFFIHKFKKQKSVE